jgi:hypothetical protein
MLPVGCTAVVLPVGVQMHLMNAPDDTLYPLHVKLNSLTAAAA